ncbi:g409 [Coccomyxa elongata]
MFVCSSQHGMASSLLRDGRGGLAALKRPSVSAKSFRARRTTATVPQCSRITSPAFVSARGASTKRGQFQVTCAAASAAASDGSEASVHSSAKFTRTRWITFLAMFAGYASFYLTRNSLAFTAPTMIEDVSLGLDMTSVGGLTSVLPVAYGFSKFLSGVLGARTSPTILLSGGLAATAFVNIAFGMSSSYPLLLALWGLNGLLQGLGAPACARILTLWYPDKERGTFWGFWTASNNIGGFAAPILAGTAATMYGWRYGMFAPGAVALAVSVLVLLFMKDSPEKEGFPPIDEGAPKKKVVDDKPAAKEDKPGLLTLLVEDCLKNPYVWLFAISYFFVYVVRQGVTSWFIFYLKDKGVQNAAVQVSGLELGGLLGSLSSGAISDYLVRNNDGSKGNVGLRVQVVMAYAFATAALLGVFWVSPNVAWIQWLIVAAVGFALYGPQMLIGLCGAEVVRKPAVSAAQGFLGWISYLGAANAGVPLAHLVQTYGWNAYFTSMIGACGIVLLLMAPMTRLESYSQRMAKAELKNA